MTPRPQLAQAKTRDQTQGHGGAAGRGARREAVLAAAVEEFTRWGYEAASTNRVAATARVAKGLIFRHFRSKEGLFNAALERACQRLFAPLAEALPADPFARLEEFLVRRLAWIAAHPVEAGFIARFRGRLRSVLSPPARRIDEFYARLRDRFREGIDGRAFRSGVDPQAAVELLLLAAEGFERRAWDWLAAGGEAAAATTAGGCSLELARQRVGLLVDVLRRGMYRPGARAAGPTVPPDPKPFLAALEHLAPVNAPGDQRRERILRAAQELFAERGYDGASAEAVAERAGVAKGLIFHYFGSKAGLYLTPVADAAARISAVFFEREDGPDSDLLQRLLDWTRRKTLIFQEQPELYGLVLSAVADPPDAAQAAVQEYVAEGTRRGWDLILKGVDTASFRPDIDPAQAVDLVMMVVDTLADRLLVQLGSHPQKGVDLLPAVTEQTAVYLALLRDGLGDPDEVHTRPHS